MIATFTDRSGARVVPPAGLKFTPGRYSWRDIGGPLQATIDADGPESDLWGLSAWLRYGVEVWDRRSEAVWWGYVSAVRITAGALTISYSLDTMANRVRVVYQRRNSDGTTERAVTADADDAFSQAYFGLVKEVAVRAGTLDAAAAAYLRDETLATLKYFAPSLEVASREAGEVSVSLECAGWWQTLSWRLASVTSRDESYTELNQYGPNGFDIIYFPFGYTNGAKGDGPNFLCSVASGGYAGIAQSFTLSTSNARQPVKVENVQCMLWRNNSTVTGTVICKIYADASGTPTSPLLGTFTSIAASTLPTDAQWITFTPDPTTADIWLMPGARYLVDLSRSVGPADPDTVYWMGLQTAYGSETTKAYNGSWVTPPSIIGMNLRVSVSHGESSLTAGATSDKQKIGQSFQIAGSAALEVGSIGLRAFRMGTIGHTIYVGVYSDSAGSPGSLVERVSVDPDTLIGTEFDWLTVTFTNAATLTPATSYWIVIDPNGATSPNAFVAFAASLAKGYVSGSTKVYNGSAWATPSPDAELLFDLKLAALTTSQVSRLITDYGALLGATTIQDASGVYSEPGRDGESDALREITQLLHAGSTNGRRMLARVLRDKTVTITEAPAAAAGLYLDRGGRITDAVGLPAHPQTCPVGLWLAPRDVVPAGAPAAPLGAATLFYIEESEYDPKTRGWRPRLRGQRDTFDLGGIRL